VTDIPLDCEIPQINGNLNLDYMGPVDSRGDACCAHMQMLLRIYVCVCGARGGAELAGRSMAAGSCWL